MGGKRNRSRAMVLAAKRRGPNPVPPQSDLAGGHPFESPANLRKKRFEDGSAGDDGEDDGTREGCASLMNVPPPPTVPITRLTQTNATRPSPKVTRFEQYYRRQRLVADESEWVDFFAHLRRPLPVTFRVSRMASHERGVQDALHEGDALLHPTTHQYATVRTDQGRIVHPPRELAWCGGYQLGCDKNALKYSQHETLRETQRWLVKHNSTGIVTRQAVDSMVPAAMLDVRPEHRVLDLCASPGSKTTQVLEMVCAGAEASDAGIPADPPGCVVANDADPRRCYFLVRRCAALGFATRALMITNHRAQWFPNPEIQMRSDPSAARDAHERYPDGCFDRILCDVPCSGDGTLRKNPQIWNEWRPEFALGLHALQTRIAMRGIALLKVGGYMVYSTCSFNPVENEAVVAAVLAKCGDAVELVDAADRAVGLKRRPGMTTWKVITMEDDVATEWNDYEETQSNTEKQISPGLRRALVPTVFPPRASGVTKLGKRIKGPPLERCARLVPHDQDMGGFFAALLRKVKPLSGPKPPRNRPSTAAASTADTARVERNDPKPILLRPMTPRTPKQHAYVPATASVLRAMKKAFGIPLESHARFDETFGSRLFTRDAGHANLTYFSPGAMPPGGGGGGASRLNCVWGGARVFERRGSGVGEFAPRKSEDVSSSSLAEGNSPGEVSIEGETFLSAYRLARDGAILLASFHSSRIVALPSRDVEKILRSFVSGGSGTEDGVPSERLTPTARDACGRLAVGSIIVTTRDASGYGGRGRTNACPPLAVERLASGALRIEWRYRRGSEGAPRAVAEALLTRLRRHREDAGV